MNFAPFVRTAVVCGFLALSSSLFAQQQKAEAKPCAEINNVKFLSVAVGGIKEKMTRVEVDVRALANAKLQDDKNAIVDDPHWVDRIKVTLTLAYVAPAHKRANRTGAEKPEDKFIYYRAAATILTMQANDSGSIYFYMPGEIIKRGNLKKPEPDLWLIDLEVDGKPVPTAKKMLSSKLTTDDLVKKFRELADRGVTENPGILRTQFQVDDWNLANTLTLVREDTTRQ